jgi:hypothetical protein
MSLAAAEALDSLSLSLHQDSPNVRPVQQQARELPSCACFCPGSCRSGWARRSKRQRLHPLGWRAGRSQAGGRCVPSRSHEPHTQERTTRRERQCDGPWSLGKTPPDAHIEPMSHKASSPRTLDLFEVTLNIPTPASEPAPVASKPTMLASLSDAQVAEQLGQLVAEVQRRLRRAEEPGRGWWRRCTRRDRPWIGWFRDPPNRSGARDPTRLHTLYRRGSAKPCGPRFWPGWHRAKWRSISVYRLPPSARYLQTLPKPAG